MYLMFDPAHVYCVPCLGIFFGGGVSRGKGAACIRRSTRLIFNVQSMGVCVGMSRGKGAT